MNFETRVRNPRPTHAFGWKRIALGAIVAMITFALTDVAVAQAVAPNDAAFAPGEVLIRFKAGAREDQVLDSVRRGRLDRVRRTFRLRRGGQSAMHLISTQLDVRAAVRELARHPAVEYVEPNYKVYPSATPNDPQFSSQWPLTKISATAAWDNTTGSSTVLVGVLDTGIDFNHPDLAANIWTNPGEVAGDGIDNDNNGYVDDVRGWDWWNGDNSVFDAGEQAHGTHVAGTIGAVGNNGTGVAGVNWQVKIVPLKFIGPQHGYNSGVIAGIEYAAANGVTVVNGSFGSPYFGQGVFDAINESGILFVAAAGNNAANSDTVGHYPSGYDLGNIISVAATTSSDGRASFSNYGATSVDLGAPGESILSTLPNGAYGLMNGTSMAAPHVAGVAALIHSFHPDLNPGEVKYRILSSTDPVVAMAGKSVTGGRLNAAKALLPPVPSSSIAADGFESNNFTGGTGSWSGGWTVSGDASLLTQDGPAEGSRHVRLRRGTGELRRTVNVGGATGLRLAFKSKVSSFESSDSANVFVSTDGSPFTPVATFTSADSDNQYRTYEIEVITGPVAQLQILFDAAMNATNDNWYIDDIRVTGTIANRPPVADAGPPRFATDSDGDGSETLTLNGANSFDPDGAIMSYEWTLGEVVIGTSPVLELDVPVGTSTATLIVTDEDGAARSDSVLLTVNATQVVAFTDTFERTSLSPWTQDSQNDWASSTQRSTPSGTRSAEVDGSATDAQLISPVIDVQGIYATVTFDWLIESGLDAGEYIACDISQDGGATWIEFGRLSGDVHAENVWHPATMEVSTPQNTLRIRFRGKMNGSDEDANVDNVKVVAH